MKKLLTTLGLAALLSAPVAALLSMPGCSSKSSSIDSKIQATITPTQLQSGLKEKRFKHSAEVFLDTASVVWKQDFKDSNKLCNEIKDWKYAYVVCDMETDFESEGYDVHVVTSPLETIKYSAKKNDERIYFIDKAKFGIIDENDSFELNGKPKYSDSAKNAGFQKLLSKWEEKTNSIAQEKLCEYTEIIINERNERRNQIKQEVAKETEELKDVLK